MGVKKKKTRKRQCKYLCQSLDRGSDTFVFPFDIVPCSSLDSHFNGQAFGRESVDYLTSLG